MNRYLTEINLGISVFADLYSVEAWLAHSGRCRRSRPVLWGFVAAVLIIVALHAAAIVPFLIATAIAGIARGSADSGGMRAVLVAAALAPS
jgi:hypothetical protein